LARKRLGDLLLENGLITEEQLEEALFEQKKSGLPLGTLLTQKGIISEQQLIEAIEFQLGVPHVNLENFVIEKEIIDLVPEELARRYKVIPLKKRGNRLTLAMADPLDYFAIDDIRMTVGMPIDPVIATRSSLDQAIEKYYGFQHSLTEVLKDISGDEMTEDQVRSDDAPIVRMVNQMIEQAVDERASDIHIDCQRTELVVRFRIDGALYRQMQLPKHLQSVLTARIKIMANLNIAERRLPQDGRIQMMVRGRMIDLRVATLPTIYGEKIVLRLLDKQNAFLQIEQLGLSEKNRQMFMDMIQSPHGIVLVTGPTGSGKSSTLYAALQYLNSEEKNLITIEDPVEYQLDGINQVQVNPSVGLTFATGLRSILREDPNIIMIGEIRDRETVEIAFRAALTGHLVLSTLHTNDAPSTITRLIDMGIEPYLIASALRGVVAQRLVRKICPQCREAYSPFPHETAMLEKNGFSVATLWRGRGCRVCHQTGYRGRLAIHEVLPFDSQIRNLVREIQPAEVYREWAERQGYGNMLLDGVSKAVQGLTTLDEVLRQLVLA
jgi:type IV pilus assembly protein PilB